jgi:predicted MFS family arabinose efflux permease
MVLAAPTVLPHVAPAQRGLATGAMFTGIGLGIIASGTLVPVLLRAGLAATWCGLGAIALVFTLLSWRAWPDEPVAVERRRPSPPALRLLYVEYGLNAIGLVPPMVFLVDFVARGLNQGLVIGARYWVLYGLGAVVGPILAGHGGDRIGFRTALRLAFLLQAVVVALPALTIEPVLLAVSSLAAGACTPGIVALALGRVRELVGQDPYAQKAGWSVATTAYALCQAGAAYGFSFLFARGSGYGFAIGSGALVLALGLDLLGGRRRPEPQEG